MISRVNDKMRAFCRYYANCHNITESAQKAGYSKRTAAAQGSRMLKDVKIIELVKIEEQKIKDRLKLSIDEIVTNARWLIDYGTKNKKPNAVAAGNDQLAKIQGAYTERHVFEDNTQIGQERRLELEKAAKELGKELRLKLVNRAG